MNDQNTSNQENGETRYLTGAELLELGDDGFETYFRQMLREQLRWLHEMTAADTCLSEVHELPESDNEPHGMHSDDGYDYLEACIDITHDMMGLHDSLTEEKRAWVLALISPDAEYGEPLDANPYYNSQLFCRYACDGPANIIHALIPNPEDNENTIPRGG